MRPTRAINTTNELFLTNGFTAEESTNISVAHLEKSQLYKYLDTTIHIRSSMFILVLNGTASIEINFSKYEIKPQKIILLSFGHFFKIHRVSPDFKCVALYVSQAYIDEMYSTEMTYKRVKYGVKMYKTPSLQLDNDENDVLYERLGFIQKIAANSQHRYYKEIILTSLLIFFLDLSNIIEKDEKKINLANQSRDELYFQEFLELLVINYKSKHCVDFYAEKLHITPHYLTLMVKKLSGRSVSGLIFQLLFGEAKLLLQQPRLSIQQVAAELHFSDQSAFGKFFKRKSGLSPREYCNRMNA